MERIAQGHDRLRRIARDNRLHPLQRRARVVGRQHLAAHRERRALLQMDIGENKHRLRRPP